MTADTVGGVWSYALELANGLAGRGVETVLATMGRPPTPEQQRAAAAVPGLVLESEAFALEWVPDAEADIAAAGDWLLHLGHVHAPDIVHLNGYAHAALPWQAPCVVVAHSCVESWWRAVWGTAAPAEWETYRRRVAQGLAAADLVVAPTAAFLDSLNGIYGPIRRARVIRNGRDAGGFAPEPKQPIVFAAGRVWDEAKNLTALDKAAAGLPWPVHVAGDVRRPDGRTVELENARCLGVLDARDTAAWMARAAIFASPARYEPFGLAVLEAALSGCALVLGDIPTLRELWADAALFVSPDNTEELRAALLGLIGDPARTAALGEAARRRAADYGTAPMTAGYCAAYSDLIAGRSGGGLEARRHADAGA